MLSIAKSRNLEMSCLTEAVSAVPGQQYGLKNAGELAPGKVINSTTIKAPSSTSVSCMMWGLMT
jgi:hypothetical protein